MNEEELTIEIIRILASEEEDDSRPEWVDEASRVSGYSSMIIHSMARAFAIGRNLGRSEAWHHLHEAIRMR